MYISCERLRETKYDHQCRKQIYGRVLDSKKGSRVSYCCVLAPLAPMPKPSVWHTSNKAGSMAIGRANGGRKWCSGWVANAWDGVLRWLRVREMLTRSEMLIGSWKVLCLDKHSSLLDPGGVPDEVESLERGTSLNCMDMNELILGCMSTESTSSVPLLKKWRQELACEALLG
ncbi:hypothetical protein QYE76_042152 [Lolium multiflorum]|uniref:Uncharacterized protein n=1 Tax=Lolium multiflorum TaxID=4521 RepID=A0AAD8WUU0_LOLMU|nr:hypothetical protein QYE76_042152 [Lolium multiflorum]